MLEKNGKIHLSGSSYLKLGLTIACMIWVGAVAWTNAKNGITANAAEISKASKDRRIMKIEDKKQTKEITTITTTVKKIEKDVDKIQTSTQNTNNLVQRMAGKMGID